MAVALEERRCTPYTRVDLEREKKFHAKFLYRAICDYVNYRNSKSKGAKELFQAARDWIYGPSPNEEECVPPEGAPSCWDSRELYRAEFAMSFEGICADLDWDADWTRRNIKKLTKSDLKRIGKNGVL